MLVALGVVALVAGADSYFVGKLGTGALASIGFALSVTAVITNVAMGFGVGVTAAVARARGEGNPTKVARLAVDALIMATGLAIALSVVAALGSRWLLSLLGTSPEVMPGASGYRVMWLGGFVLLTIVMVGTGILRGLGDMRASGALVLLAALVNLILDPILIFGAGMNLRGAALAVAGGNAHPHLGHHRQAQGGAAHADHEGAHRAHDHAALADTPLRARDDAHRAHRACWTR
jgi:Na+-driven multidrug efflux pump